MAESKMGLVHGGGEQSLRAGIPIETLWTVGDVARFLRCSTSFVYKRAMAGGLPCVRFGAMVRFDPAIIRALAQGTPGGDPTEED